MPTRTRLCDYCELPLDRQRRSDARYHPACKTAAYRERIRIRAGIDSSDLADRLAGVEPLLTPQQAAMIRLMADAIIARHHLAGRGGRPAFAAYGPTGTGKSILAQVTSRLFGFDYNPVVHLTNTRSGSLLGRLRQRRGGWTFEPSVRLGRPFLCLDELTRARTSDLRRDAFTFLESDGTIDGEAETLRCAPVVLVTFNLPRKHSLETVWDPAYQRRAFGLDTRHMPAFEPEAVSPWLAEQRAPINLDAFSVPAMLHPAQRAALDRLHEYVSPSAWQLTERRAVEELILGRTGREPDQDPEVVALAVVEDLLSLAETRRDLASQVRAAREAEGQAAAEISTEQADGLRAAKQIIYNWTRELRTEAYSKLGPADLNRVLVILADVDNRTTAAGSGTDLERLDPATTDTFDAVYEMLEEAGQSTGNGSASTAGGAEYLDPRSEPQYADLITPEGRLVGSRHLYVNGVRGGMLGRGRLPSYGERGYVGPSPNPPPAPPPRGNGFGLDFWAAWHRSRVSWDSPRQSDDYDGAADYGD